MFGPNGHYRNKFGMAVGFRWKGLNVIRVYNDSPNNPKTADQVLARAYFALVGKMAGALTDVLRFTMRAFGTKNHTTPQGQFVKQNYSLVSGTAAAPEIDYELLTLTPTNSKLTGIALGEVDMSVPLTVSVPVDDSYSDPAHNSANDKLYLVVYSKTANEMVISDGTAKRTSETVSVRVPGYWQGHFVEVYAFMAADETSARAGEFSKTLYCGAGRIA